MADQGLLGLADKVCVVTGGAGGIGGEIGRQFAAAGARVALLDRDAAAVTAAAGAGGRTVGIACDVADEARVATAADTVAATFGPCDVLVNTAAAIYADALMQVQVQVAKWNQLMAVNLTGYLLCAQAFGRQMMAGQGGSMVHVGSISGHVPQPFSGAYSVRKAGVSVMSRLLAVELGEHGVRSNTVSPAMVITPMSVGFCEDGTVRARREAVVPARRIGVPHDIAGAVMFLASDRSSYVTGQEIVVDGGLS